MGIRSFTRAALLLAGAASLVTAQTIVSDSGAVVTANEETVAPAAEQVVNAASDANAFQLTDAVLANLTSLQLSNISFFDFSDDSEEAEAVKRGSSCKVMPGDVWWPTKLTWKVFDLLTGGALIETVPIGAVCYPSSGVYNAGKCQTIKDGWALSSTHSQDPTSIMSPLFQGETCMPEDGATSTCKLGGFPSYSVEIRNVAQIQLAINFARNLNLRLVVKNTGHDFLGKSTGAGALSIWTHKLKTLDYMSSIKTTSYTGPAFKLGAGVQVFELYEAANKLGVTAVGGECDGVGVTGGFIAGGGHSPLSSILGLGADQVLSIDVVLPNGRFVTADEKTNTDLFWALRGGGGATFGVVTSMTVKVYPKMKFAGATWTVLSGDANGIPDKTFWAAMYAYWRKFPQYTDLGTYAYSQLFPTGTGYLWIMTPWLVPGMSLVEFKAMIAPLLAEWKTIGFELEPTYFETDNLYDAWTKYFPFEGVARKNARTGSRLFPKSQWDNETFLVAMMDEVKAVVEEGCALIQYNINAAAPKGSVPNSANSHWRDTAWYAIMGAGWDASTAESINRKITSNWMQRLKAFAPGGYGNEGDVMEPDFGPAFFGTNYDRLLQIKKKIDPTDVFWAPTAVGSDRWEIRDQNEWLTLQTGRLCKK
ncbi:hypothetical protein B0T17DRAFT_494420 [Bombardia bombarda]|uniref:FAD-binding PCMH-type domain-containing protein n=1 Tax=Bombardia bombarda TaxID=252184 RepID=A0AA39WUZ7_9PEZI|nr:hypothetical protein B0T17DRAFT_494420 [Bombardia bombarda]